MQENRQCFPYLEPQATELLCPVQLGIGEKQQQEQHPRDTAWHGSLKDNVLICALAKQLPTHAKSQHPFLTPWGSQGKQGPCYGPACALWWNLYTSFLTLLFVTVSLWNHLWMQSHYFSRGSELW